jgi:uncharacterized protein (TIGR02145 family)
MRLGIDFKIHFRETTEKTSKKRKKTTIQHMKKAILTLWAAIGMAMLLSAYGDHEFNEVTIGTQVWMSENLNVGHFRNGDPIPEAKTDEEWAEADKKMQPAWCYYDNDPANGAKYGKLYNWHAVNDARGLAPLGYRIPSDEDWGKLTAFLGRNAVAGKKMKSTSGWDKKGNGNNRSGFSGLPGGHRSGQFSALGIMGYWWSLPGPIRVLNEEDGYLAEVYFPNGMGFSVRCIKEGKK